MLAIAEVAAPVATYASISAADKSAKHTVVVVANVRTWNLGAMPSCKPEKRQSYRLTNCKTMLWEQAIQHHMAAVLTAFGFGRQHQSCPSMHSMLTAAKPAMSSKTSL